MIKTFLCYEGYVEDVSYAAVPFTHETGFATAEEGMVHLREALSGIVFRAKRGSRPQCCRAAPPEANYCPSCGTRALKEKSTRVDELWSELRNGDESSMGDYFPDFWEEFNAEGWSPGFRPGSEFVAVFRTAEFMDDGNPAILRFAGD